MGNEDLKVLIQKYQDGTCTEEQRRLIEGWYASRSMSNADFDFPENFWQDKEAGLQQILFSTKSKHKDTPSFKFPLRVAAMAATIVVILGIGISFYSTSNKGTKADNSEIAPAISQATLTLTNGRRINLSSRNNGIVAMAHGVNITKSKNGILVYDFNSGHTIVPGKLNVLSTPRGGQYQVILPDGSKVWLNAESELQFPSTFNGLGERKVLLKGEAYFEVAQIKSNSGNHKGNLPFIVKTANQEVIVLGTHFNIKSYISDPDTRTTLLEGSVRISAPAFEKGGIMLVPGDQAVNNGSEIKVKKVDTDEILAWKNREFVYDNVPLEVIMRDVALWYNIEVKYEDEALRSRRIGCIQSRDSNISDVLSTFEVAAGVHFKMKGRQVTVMK